MSTEEASDGQRAEAIEKYSVFTTAGKWCIIAMVSYAAWFSILSSFGYYSAIHQLSQIFSVSVDKINLTVTSYIAVATVAPTLVGDTADVLGRRPVYVFALSLYRGQYRHRSVEYFFSASRPSSTTSSGNFWHAFRPHLGFVANVFGHLLNCLRVDYRCCISRRKRVFR